MARSSLQVVGVGLFCLALLVRKNVTYEFTVGGSTGWSIPSDPNAKNFQSVGRTEQVSDGRLHRNPAMNQEDYNSCSTASPFAKYVDGHTVFEFNHSSPFNFISRNKHNCLKNEKPIVVMLADRSTKSIVPSGTSRPRPPSDEQAPSPPPAGTVEITPALAQASTEPSPPNNVGSLLVSLAGSVGALIASSLLLAP